MAFTLAAAFCAHAAAASAPRNKAVWGALAFVVGAAVLDVIVARGLDRTTGKTFPVREPVAA